MVPGRRSNVGKLTTRRAWMERASRLTLSDAYRVCMLDGRMVVYTPDTLRRNERSTQRPTASRLRGGLIEGLSL